MAPSIAPKRCIAVSAPGKVLFAGGFLVLDRQHNGLVFGLDARIHVRVESWEGEASSSETDSDSRAILVQSPQFEDASWYYMWEGRGKIWQVTDDGRYTKSGNGFIATALEYTLTYLAQLNIRLDYSLKITILADDDYYSQSGTRIPGKFTKFGVALRDAHKTGLGSSAALVTSLVAGLLAYFNPEQIRPYTARDFFADVTALNAQNRRALPTRAFIDLGAEFNTVPLLYVRMLGLPIDSNQAERFEGLGDLPVQSIGTIVLRFRLIGSGEEFTETFHVLSREHDGEYGVTTLFLGTEFAKRLYLNGWSGWRALNWTADQQKVIHNLAQAAHCAAQGKVGSGFDVAAATYGSCLYRRFSPAVLEGVGDSSAPDFGERLHRCVANLNPDVQWDADVSNQAVKIPESLLLVMCDVDCGSETPGMVKKVLAWRKERPAEAALIWAALQQATEDLCGELRRLSELEGIASDGNKDLADIIMTIRSLVREMSEKSKVPIEPPVITELLDYCTSLPGVVGGVAPGAGGYDAVALLVRNDGQTVQELQARLEGWKSRLEKGDGPSIGRVSLLQVKQEKAGVKTEDPQRYSEWV